MKAGDEITTKDGIELIAVPFSDHYDPCNGCFFYREGKCDDANIVCWDKKNGDDFILTSKKI